jgi:NAD(P)-dependent dehydrogenase (short-subunit alcohol dehydrogenase family)
MNGRMMAKVAGAIGIALLGRQLLRSATAWRFRDKVVLITGGSRGLGLVLARRFIAEGAIVAIAARDREEIRHALQDLHQRGGQAVGWIADLTDPADAEKLVRAIMERFGRIDMVVNNAGVIQVGPIEAMSLADFHDALDSDFWSAVHVIEAALPHLRRARGRIVNIASIGGKVGVPHLIPYCAAKFALVGYSQGLRAELAKDGVVVTTICPGLMRTGSHGHAQFKGQQQREYALFSIVGSLPLMSMSAESAAAQILDACRHGDAEAILGMTARAAAFVNQLLPGATSFGMSLVARCLPTSDAKHSEAVPGSDSHSWVAPSLLTRPNENAERENNEAIAR